MEQSMSSTHNTASGVEQYNLAAIRQLLQTAFTADDLRRFCLDRPSFRFIPNHFGPGFSFMQMIDVVLEQCRTQDLFSDLLAAVGQVNPRQYERHGPYFLQEDNQLRLGSIRFSTAGTMGRALSPIPTAPAPPPHFVDRQAELGRLLVHLTADAPVVTTAVQGMGGTGKTALAQKLAAQAADHFPGGVLWTTLGPQPDPFHILESWALTADGDVRSHTDLLRRAAAVRSLLALRGQMLAILDDAWEYECPHLLMHQALPANASVLVTTRDAGLAKQLRCRVESLDILPEEDALDLLTHLLGPLDPYEPAAREVVHLVGYVPLALELAAGLADEPADLPEVARRLKTRPTLRALRLGSGEQRDQSVESSLSLSYAALPARLQRCFRYLGSFAPSPFDADAVAVVWTIAPDEPDREQVPELLRILTRQSLLSRQEGGAYSQHSLLRAYALALLEREGEAERAAMRHAAYYRALGLEADWRTMETAFGQIRHGWEAIQAYTPEQAVAYLQPLVPFLRWSGRWQTLVRWIEYTLEQTPQAREPGVRGRLLNELGYVYWLWGRGTEALDSLQPALGLCRQAGDRWGEAQALHFIGLVHRTASRFEQAMTYAHQSLNIRQEIGDGEGIGFCLHSIGLVHRLAGRYPQAVDFLRQGLVTFERDGHDEGISLCTANLGRVYRAMGRYEEALEYMQQGLALACQIGDRTGEGETLNTLGDVYRFWGNYERALDLYQQSLEIHQELGSPVGQAYVVGDMGEIFFSRGDYDRAFELYRQALELWQHVGDRKREASLLDSLGCVQRVKGENTLAIDLLQRSLALRREIGDRAGEGRALNQIGAVHLAEGDLSAALDCFSQALAIARETAARPGESAVLNNMGLVFARQGEYGLAFEHLEQSLAIARELGEKGEEGIVQWNLGRLYQEMGQPEEAELALGRACALHQQVGCAYGDGVRRWFE
jgi:tetratricopeptide (TPR) repeat protein